MIENVEIADFLELAKSYTVLDVRSPGEYAHAHIPGAYNLPLFSDEERKIVGTAYKQEGREQAIKLGLDYFGVKMRRMVEEVETIIKSKSKIPNSKHEMPILVHCWRGGMRSAGVAWLMDLYGFKVYVLQGGYKAFRNWTLQQLEEPRTFKIIGGYTGSGKTGILKMLEQNGQPVIDLEGIARHKGSAFGALGQGPQPSQEMFENELGMKLHEVGNDHSNAPIWLEDESRRIGNVNLPAAIWNNMQKTEGVFLDVPFEERLQQVMLEYGSYGQDALAEPIMRIKKRLGGEQVKAAIAYLAEDNVKECFRILLQYYDKHYSKGVQERKDLLKVVPCTGVDATTNVQLISAHKTTV